MDNKRFKVPVKRALWESARDKALKRFPWLRGILVEGREYIFARNARNLIGGYTFAELDALCKIAEGQPISKPRKKVGEAKPSEA